MTDTECELKLALAPADYERLRDALPGRQGEVEQHNLFLDTVDGRLAAKRWALRIRRESAEGEPARVIVTAKGPTLQLAGAAHRTELEIEVADTLWHRGRANALCVEDVVGPPGTFLRQELGIRGPLHAVLEFTNLRTIFAVELAGERRLLEVDRTDFATGERDHELELELASAGKLSPAELVLEIRVVRVSLETLLAELGIGATRSAGGKFSHALRYAGR